MVTNPATRDWTVTASLFATLNEMFGNRTICGIGRGDSAVRVTNGRPTTLATLREAMHVIRELANGRAVDYKGSSLRFPWAAKSRLDVWMAAYGPKALALCGEVADGFILQLADPDIVAWTVKAVRDSAEAAGRDPAEVTICVAAPAYVGDDVAHQRDQTRWFGGMVGNHVADIVGRYGGDGAAGVPEALTEYIKGRKGYDYNEHGQAGNPDAAFVPGRDRRPVLPARSGRAPRRAAARAEGRWASTSSRSTCSTTGRTRRWPRTASASCPPSPTTWRPSPSGASRPMKRRGRRALLGVLGALLLVVLWEGYKALGQATNDRIGPFDLPGPHRRPVDAPRVDHPQPLRRSRAAGLEPHRRPGGAGGDVVHVPGGHGRLRDRRHRRPGPRHPDAALPPGRAQPAART